MVKETTIDTITTPNWQMSLTGLGVVATDGDDILQSIHNILFTMKGECPFNSEQGSDIFKKIDLPINKVGAAVSAEVIDAITKWEPRVTITEVKPVINLDFSVTWNIKMIVKASKTPLGYALNLNSAKENRRAFSDAFSAGAFA